MAKIQKCRNGCEQLIVVQFDEGRWLPFNVDVSGNPTHKHDCPKSEYNLKKAAGGGGGQQTQQQPQYVPESNTSGVAPGGGGITPTDRPSLEAVLLNQISQAVTRIENQKKDDVDSTLAEKLEAISEMVNQNRMMLEALVAHFKLTEPKKASELINHSAKADEYEMKQKQIDELKEQGVVKQQNE